MMLHMGFYRQLENTIPICPSKQAQLPDLNGPQSLVHTATIWNPRRHQRVTLNKHMTPFPLQRTNKNIQVCRLLPSMSRWWKALGNKSLGLGHFMTRSKHTNKSQRSSSFKLLLTTHHTIFIIFFLFRLSSHGGTFRHMLCSPDRFSDEFTIARPCRSHGLRGGWRRRMEHVGKFPGLVGEVRIRGRRCYR